MKEYVDAVSTLNPTRGGYDRKYRRIRGIGEFVQRQSAQIERKSGNDVRSVRSGLGQEEKGDYP